MRYSDQEAEAIYEGPIKSEEHVTYTCNPKEVEDYTLFHRLWSHAVNSPDYRKDEWQELERRIRRDKFYLK